jgi:hypothetical protein
LALPVEAGFDVPVVLRVDCKAIEADPGRSKDGGAAYILSGKAFSPRKEHNTGDFAESIFAKKCKAKQPPGRVAVVEAGAEAPAIV